MNIGFLTTINTNIGDDFIRIGIENVILSLRENKPTRFTYVNKHHPEEVLSANSPLRMLHKLPAFRGKQRLENIYYYFLHRYFNVYANQQLIIQSGAPVLWPNCFNSEWNEPVWYQTIGKLYREIPVLNLAAGSCYPWERQEGFTNDGERQFAKRTGGYCKLVTTRDELSHKLFLEAETPNVLLPCSAFLVQPGFENKEAGKYILINYMHAGGHFDWNQKIDAMAWEVTMKVVISNLVQHHEVRFICHNEKEAELAAALYPGLQIHLPANVGEYMNCIKHAKAGICNRMHASVAMAGVGVPSVSVCTDTRLLMLDLLGLPVFYVKNASSESLISTVESLLKNASAERNRLFELKEKTFNRYRELLQPYCR